jgi:hypothetical protein
MLNWRGEEVAALSRRSLRISFSSDGKIPTHVQPCPIKKYLFVHYLTSWNLAVALSTAGFNIQKFYVVPTLRLCVLYGSQNKQPLLPYTTFTDWFVQPRRRVFTVRYGLSPYTTHTPFVFKWLMTLHQIEMKWDDAILKSVCRLCKLPWSFGCK